MFDGASKVTYPSESTKSLTLAVPAGAQPGDLLIASLGFGSTSASAQPTITPPAGWTLVSRTNQGVVDAIAVYRHVFAAGETSYTWATSVSVGGASFLAAFSGVDTTTPTDGSAGQALLSTVSATTPSLTTPVDGEVLIASSYAHRNNATSGSWTPPPGMTEIGDASNGGSRSGSLDIATEPTAGSTGPLTVTAAASQDYTIATLTALRPAGATPPPPPVTTTTTPTTTDPTSTDTTPTTTTSGLDDTDMASSAAAVGPGWRLVFRDTFDNGIDPLNWGLYSGQPGGDTGGWWDPSHVVASDGIAHLETYQDPKFNNRWVSGGMSSSHALKQTYGKYLVRFRVTPGFGVLTALLLWPSTTGWPPEIDFAENGGSSTDRPTMTATLHYGSSNSQIQHTVSADFTNWHIMGVEWTPGQLVYTLDGAPWATVNSPGVPSAPMEFDMQAQAGTCGDVYAPCPDATTPSLVDLQVDWVQAWAYAPGS
jgi:hypothetical protein